MDMKAVRIAYLAQTYQAANRGIRFYFTYEAWIMWWEEQLGPNWFELRGCHCDEYVMARIGDKGSYGWWNVECKLAGDNIRDQVVNGTSNFGEKHGGVKLTEKQAIAVRNASGTLGELAAKFGVHKSTIRYIKQEKLWSHLTTPICDYEREHECERKLTKEQVVEIFYAKGTKKEIGARYGVTDANVGCIRKRLSWQHLTKDLPDRNDPLEDKRTRITDDQVREIFYAKGHDTEIAKRFNTSESTVWAIKHKQRRPKVTANL